MAKKIDMVNGKMFTNLISFAIPTVIANVLQAFYSVVARIVVGKYESSIALGAVGSAAQITDILQTILWGMSLGTNVLVASSFGAGDMRRAKKVADTGITIALCGGLAIFVIGQLFTAHIINAMNLAPEIHTMAVQYLRISLIGLPFNALFNYISAILRATGDAKRPMYISIIAGFINLTFSIVFVKYLHLGIRGSAIAIMSAQSSAGLLSVIMLMKSSVKVNLLHMKPSFKTFVDTIKIGLPSGFQNVLVSFTSLIGVSILNSFGAAAVAANAIVNNFVTIINSVVGAVTSAVIPFTSQNIGAKKYHKLNKLLLMGWGVSISISLLFIVTFSLFKWDFISLFMSDNDTTMKAEILRISNIIFTLYIVPYFLTAFSGVPGNIIVGMGKTTITFTVGIIVSCGFKIFWQLVILPLHKTIEMFYISNIIIWILCATAYVTAYIYCERKLNREQQKTSEG